MTAHGVEQVGIEGSAGWGAHAAIALVRGRVRLSRGPRAALGGAASGTSVGQDRRRRRGRRGAGLLAEPTLGPVQAFEVYDPLVAKIEAVLEHRRMLVTVRTLVLHHVQDQISQAAGRDPRPAHAPPARSKDGCAGSNTSTPRSCPRWPASTGCRGSSRSSTRTAPRVARSASSKRDIDALLDEHGTTLRDEPGIGPIAAATLVAEVGDPFRFARESKFARWCGTGAVALSSGEGDGLPVKHRLDFRGNRRINSVLYIASVTQHRDLDDARDLHRPQARRGQDPSRSPPSPQTTPRQPRHPTHVERRITRQLPRSHRDLTRERRTLPGPLLIDRILFVSSVVCCAGGGARRSEPTGGPSTVES